MKSILLVSENRDVRGNRGDLDLAIKVARRLQALVERDWRTGTRTFQCHDHLDDLESFFGSFAGSASRTTAPTIGARLPLHPSLHGKSGMISQLLMRNGSSSRDISGVIVPRAGFGPSSTNSSATSPHSAESVERYKAKNDTDDYDPQEQAEAVQMINAYNLVDLNKDLRSSLRSKRGLDRVPGYNSQCYRGTR
ncbi:hypothetical protein PLICRDRAFT_86021 [Plicaturopsis crispa FD-325 SS-3]|nr:hypothetical protein PLICRDRAFT_86021 [Plicaturopsis crispa FD-325 SS-3]